MEALEEETYADFVRPENMDGVEPSISSKFSREPANSARRYRLSLSPLDSLQAEFKKYNNPEQGGHLRLSQPPNHRVLSLSQTNGPERTLSRKQARQLVLPSNPDGFTSLADVNEELPVSISDIPDWDFILKNAGVVENPRDSDCPSLATGSTISSRNSSTRSTRSFKWDALEPPEKGMCPYPGCGRVLRNLPAHLLTHQAERPEKCPVETCEYHTKGFARAYDRVRHTISHFKETMVCGFCPTSPFAAEKTFNRCDLFLKHLVAYHGVEQTPVVRREELNGATKQSRKPLNGQKVATCGLCSEPFDAQGFFEHLRGCALRQVTRDYTTQPPERNNKTETITRKDGTEDDIMPSSSYASLQIPRTPEHLYSPFRLLLSPLASVESPGSPDAAQSPNQDAESKEIAELTASSRCLSLTSSQDEATKSSDEETDWTEDTGSPASPASVTDAEGLRPMLSPIKRQLVERLMQEFHRIFDKMIRTHHGTGAGSARSAGSGYYTGSSGSSTYSTSSFVSRKRSLSGGSSPPPDDNEDDSNKRRRPDPKHSAGKQAVSELRFACPYYKRNPGRHQTFTSCRDPGFITVARLKEHLYRRHLLPIQCNRCCSTFANEPTLREHQRDARGCEIKDQVPLEGFDKDQERKLKSKKRSLVYQSEEDKWKGVYRILFPDDNDTDMPSPYIEYQPCTNGGQPGESSNVARFQEFSRFELPRLVRRTLEVTVEEEAQPLEERLKERLVDIVRECQTQLISLFQSTLSHPSTSPPLSLSQLQLPDVEITVEPPIAVVSANIVPVQQHPGPATPFHNFDSFQVSSKVDYIPIPAQYPEHEQLVTKHEPSPPLEGGSNTPDSGYDSTWNAAPIPQEHYIQTHEPFQPTYPFAPAATIPQHQHQHQNQAQPQPAYNPGSLFVDSDQVGLGGYYGLFQSRNTGFEASMMDPSWVYLNPEGGGDMAHSHGMGHGNVYGAVI